MIRRMKLPMSKHALDAVRIREPARRLAFIRGLLSCQPFGIWGDCNGRWAMGDGLAGAHADALDCLEEFSFGFDAGGDDDFGFLKFTNVSRAHVAHAGGDGADEVLGTVIDGGGAE